MVKSKQLGHKAVTVKMDKETLRRLNALVDIRKADSASSLLRLLVNEEFDRSSEKILWDAYVGQQPGGPP
jgi:hypothetical protein